MNTRAGHVSTLPWRDMAMNTDRSETRRCTHGTERRITCDIKHICKEMGQNGLYMDRVRSVARADSFCRDKRIGRREVHRRARSARIDVYTVFILCLLPTLANTASLKDRTQNGTLHSANTTEIIDKGSNPDPVPLSTSGDEGRTESAGWSNCPSVCTCDNDTQTVACHAKGINYTSLPATVRHLNLSQCANRQHELNPNLSDITTLGLNSNVSAASEFRGLGNLVYLQTLDISCNYLNDLNLSRLPGNLTHLYLKNNALTSINFTFLQSVLLKLKLSDLSGNHLQVLTVTSRHDSYVMLESQNYSQDSTTELATTTYNSIKTLALSGNEINKIDSAFIASFPSLSYLDLSANRIDVLQRHLFANCSKLHYLSLADNPISNLPSNSFTHSVNLKTLILAGLQVTALHSNTFVGLDNLRLLNLSNNALLRSIHGDTFTPLGNLHTLDLSNGNLATIHKPTFDSLQCEVRLAGNPWRCDCNLQGVFTTWNTSLIVDDPSCQEPAHLRGYPAIDISNNTCVGATIVNYTQTVSHKVGSRAVLDCKTNGDPSPTVTWVTPSNKVFHYIPAFANHEHLHPVEESPASHGVSANSKRLHLLANGSLCIDYVTRQDTGAYRCIVGNQYGNDSAVLQFTLDYSGFFETVLWTQIVGLCASASFLVFGILLGIIRNITSWFKIKHQEDTNRKFKGMLHSISDYKTAQIDRLNAYKTAQIGKLSAFKNSKMDKFHSLSRPSMGSALHHMQSMREHYSAQIDVIKDNCTQKAEHLRENYTLRLQRFRDYRSDKVGKLRGYKAEKIEILRENYTHQAQKIREYGSVQMARLRGSYKLQQHYLLKLYELLDIGNCMTVIEAECMRTESMLFDENFINLDLETHPVHIHNYLSDSDNDSYYVTASSQSDVSLDVYPKNGAKKDEILCESVSDDLGQEEINFSDLKLKPYPSYLNFLESIELEAQKTVSQSKQRKEKKSKKALKEQKEFKVESKRESTRKSNPKSAQRRAKTKAHISQGPGTESEEDSVANKKDQDRIHRKLKSRSKSRKSLKVDLKSRKFVADLVEGKLSPVTLRVDILRTEEDENSIYESAHASRDQSPNLPIKSAQYAQGPRDYHPGSLHVPERDDDSMGKNGAFFESAGSGLSCDHPSLFYDNAPEWPGLRQRMEGGTCDENTVANCDTVESQPKVNSRHETTV